MKGMISYGIATPARRLSWLAFFTGGKQGFKALMFWGGPEGLRRIPLLTVQEIRWIIMLFENLGQTQSNPNCNIEFFRALRIS
jgi:hypothetical protein